jgi:ribosomal protein L11 methylase PrmA
VLAIAACKLGYAPVVAIDVDEAVVEATRRNAAANAVAIEAKLFDAGAGPLPVSEIVVANIDLGTISRLEPPARCRVLATSGYYETDRPEFPEFVHADRLVREAWAADLFRRE